MTKITKVVAREILDSRGNPTVEADVFLEDGSRGRAAVPSGASTGEREAVERRDGDPHRYKGKGVLNAVSSINSEIFEAVKGMEAEQQRDIDEKLIALDGTDNKSRLGANAILAVSLAAAKAAAAAGDLPLYRYLSDSDAPWLVPAPMMNIINGGAHADNLLDFQEFMIIPGSAGSFADAVRMGAEVFHTLRESLKADGHNTNVGDEGGFAPNIKNAEQAIEYVVSAIEKAGYEAGKDVSIALDAASSEFFDGQDYVYAGEGTKRTIEAHAAYLEKLIHAYPIASLEDPMAENDYDGWKLLTQSVGAVCQLTGDDVFCTNIRELRRGIENNIANSILVKVNQIGTLTETLDTIDAAEDAAYSVVISHRSGETEDTTIADLSVAVGCGQIKTGSLSRSDRTAKYNQLIRIEQELGDQARYAGLSTLSRTASE